MIFSNLNNLTLIIFIFLLLIGIYFLYQIYKKNNNRIAFFLLFLSLLFIIINIFEIKGGLKSKIEDIEGGKIVFVLDVSKSMDSKDGLDNNTYISRLELGKKIINSYISKNLNNNYGLIIFAGEALEILPFTNDSTIFNTILYSINNTNISKNGTNLNSIFESLNNYFTNNNEGGLVVILTDLGDENINISKNILNKIEKKGVKISIVGIGGDTGAKIPIGKDYLGNDIYKTYKGQDVITKLNKQELEYISKNNEFEFTNINNLNDFSKIDDFISKNVNLITMKKNIDYRTDYTRLFIFISFTFFVLFLISDNFIGRKK